MFLFMAYKSRRKHNVFYRSIIRATKKGYFRSIIEQINSKFFIITFPTKSISGKNVGMKDYYENMMTKYIENSQMEIIFRKAYFNEIMFVIKK